MKNARLFVLPLPLLLSLGCQADQPPPESVRPMFQSEEECEKAGYSDDVCDAYEIEGRRYYAGGWIPVNSFAARPGVMGVVGSSGSYSTDPKVYGNPQALKPFSSHSIGATGKAPSSVVRGGFGTSSRGGYSS